MRDVRVFKKVTWIQNHSRVDIEIASGNAQPDIAEVAKLMNLVFLSPDEKLVDAVPDYWKDWLQHGQGYKPTATDVANAKRAETDAANVTPKVGGKISAPRAVRTTDPQYSEPARQSLYQGTCILWLIVGADGIARDIRISRALGLGLDDQAVKAVQAWRFEPALENGQPVRVQINIEINFRLN
jgi:TonB family protein